MPCPRDSWLEFQHARKENLSCRGTLSAVCSLTIRPFSSAPKYPYVAPALAATRLQVLLHSFQCRSVDAVKIDGDDSH
jgi:hypothetical protein